MPRWENDIKLDLNKKAINVWTGLRIGPIVDSCDHINEPLVSIKCGEFLDHEHQKKKSAPYSEWISSRMHLVWLQKMKIFFWIIVIFKYNT